MYHAATRRAGFVLCVFVAVAGHRVAAQSTDELPAEPADRPASNTDARHEELESQLSKMLSGATLEGSFTSTGEGSDPTELRREKYTLGEVKKLKGDIWLIPARIQYGEHDVTIPLTLPIRWADDTPVIVVDNIGLPGFGAVSARVMFFADHYAGYWKHGKNGGHLFGVIRRDDVEAKAISDGREKKKSPSGGNSPGDEQEQKQPGQQ